MIKLEYKTRVFIMKCLHFICDDNDSMEYILYKIKKKQKTTCKRHNFCYFCSAASYKSHMYSRSKDR